MRASSYPELKSTQTEAEEAAAKKALEKLPLMAKQKLPTTTDYGVSIPRVKQVSVPVLTDYYETSAAKVAAYLTCVFVCAPYVFLSTDVEGKVSYQTFLVGATTGHVL